HPYLPPFGFDRCSVCMCTEQLQIRCQRNECPPLLCSEEVAYRANPMDCCKRCPNSVPVKSIIDSSLEDQGLTDAELRKLREKETLEAGGCRFSGRIYSNGAEWNPVVQPYGEIKCVQCKCKDGVHKCRR